MDPQATPWFYKARTVPYAMRSLVDVELDRLVREGTLKPVDHSDWAAPIVSVWKPDKKQVLSHSQPCLKTGQVPHSESGRSLRYPQKWQNFHQARLEPSLPTAVPRRGVPARCRVKVALCHTYVSCAWPHPL